MKEIIKNIELIRKQKSIKQEYIAEKLGISQSAYSNYVTRNNDISLNRLSQIANILNVSIIDIITYPIKYLPQDQVIENCKNCKDKDDIIRHLNSYIQILENKSKT